MRFFQWIGRVLKRLVGLVLPMFAPVRGPRGRRVVFWILHLAVLAAILVGLGYLNHLLHLERYVRAPYAALRASWLPLLFLLFYILCWLAWWLWKLLGPEQITSVFPDIDQAWEEARVALAEAGIDVTEAPLFLVLGRPLGGEKGLFSAGQLKLQVKQAPRRPDAPLSVSANQDGIFVACAGACLLGRQAALLAGQAGAPAPLTATGPRRAPAAASDRSGDAGDGAESEAAEAAPVATATATEEEAEPLEVAGRRRSGLLRDAEELERQTARLRHLCRCLARDRRPYCPVNGILVLIPLAATGDDADAREAASLCQRDLDAVRDELQVLCPIVAAVCDLERAPGFDEFLKFFPEGQRRRFLGQQFPLVPDLTPPAQVRMIEAGVLWIGTVLFPSLVYKHWGTEGPGGEDPAAATAANVRLYRFLWDLRERQKRLARILTRGVVIRAQPDPPMLGGCCLAATGRDLVREQGFAVGVFRLLIENQNYVAWTPEALEAEADYRRWEKVGYLGLAALIAALLALGYVLWPRS